MKVIVLAAGFATRLYPLTRNHAKPLLDVAGQVVLTRLLDRVLTASGVDEIIIVANGRFEEDFRDWSQTLTTDVPVLVIGNGVTEDKNSLGGVADLARAYRAIQSRNDHDLFVVAGDNLVECDLGSLVDLAKKQGKITLFARELEELIPGRYGELTCDENGVIKSFREKPMNPKSKLTATCLYWFPKGAMSSIHEYLEQSHDCDALGLYMGWLCTRESVLSKVLPGRFFDIGNLESLQEARDWYSKR